MLRELTIENVAVIEKANIVFDTGFNCLTGETGAGKSIIIDSINAVMGERVTKDVIRTGAKSASIVAVFENINPDIVSLAQEFDVDISDECIVSRTISSEGKNTARINGIPTPINVLKAIFSEEINIHGQHDSQSLLNPSKHLGILDGFSQDKSCFENYSNIYSQYVEVKRKIKKLSEIEDTKQSDLELLQFQVDEIYTANLSVQEEQELLSQKSLIKNAEKILSGLNGAYQILSGDDDFAGVVSELQQASSNINSITDYSDKISNISDILADMADKSQDVMYEIRNIIDDFDTDFGDIEQIEERLDTYYKLKRKYGGDVESVLEYYNHAKEKLDNIQFAQDKLDMLYAQKAEILKNLEKAAEALTDFRKKQFDLLSGKIQQSLSFLNMPYVKLYLNIEDKEFAQDGKDKAEFYIITNKGESPKPLSKISSGGELSRIMLAIKSVLANMQSTDTMIFDEIDAGVSGAASMKIGKLLRQTAKDRQVLCVTHSPQIAAFADSHLYIEKATDDKSAKTTVKKLTDSQRVNEIARIISGENITQTSLENAREMLDMAKNS